MKFIHAHQIPKKIEREAEEDLAGVALDQAVVEPRGGLGDGHHEGQVEEELEGVADRWDCAGSRPVMGTCNRMCRISGQAVGHRKAEAC